MFENKQKKLIIVTDEKNKPYANYLVALISAKDDKEEEIVGVADGSVEAVIWTEKHFADSEPTLSSKQHVLFLGDTKLSKSQRGGLKIKFDDFGMKYGWLGKRGVLYVEREITSVVEYNRFYEHVFKYQDSFKKVIERKVVKMQLAGETFEVDEKEIEKVKKTEKIAKYSVAGLAAILSPITATVMAPVIAVQGVKTASQEIKSAKERKEVLQQQQSSMIMLFYMEGLKEFLEG